MTFRSGFVTLVGRPNVGKSTLVNTIVGRKVAIVSDRPQTTRTEIRGVRTTATSQIVVLDTPGIHKPRTLLGERTNQRALDALGSVDVVCMLIEANRPIGPGDRHIAALVHESGTPSICVVNKVDATDRGAIIERLVALGGPIDAEGSLGSFAAYVPLSAKTGDGVDGLIAEIESRFDEGPHYYPDDVVTDQPETFLVAELLREKLIADARDELPHSIAVVVEDFEERTTKTGDIVLAFRCVVRVERDSQKGIVIGHGGERLKAAGQSARHELERLLGARVHLDTVVRVDPDWQRRANRLDRLGL